ncbi:MAG: ral secretion pathway protein, partial [Phycisphaerales bacterium]|nr:ral secretion pathway protein [Phycisphaerales bacterium]
MFSSNSFGQPSNSMNENSSSQSAPARRRSAVRPPSRYRRLAMLSLAVAVAAPVAVTTYNHLIAAEKPVLLVQQPTLAPADALREGIRQYREGKYEESVSTLQAISADALSEPEKKSLFETLGSADKAAAARKSARAEFELGQSALQNNRPGEAIQHYNNVINNRFVDDGTKNKAREQQALAESQRKGMSGDMRTVYTSAVGDYKAGNFGQAKAKFEQLQGQGYRPAMFQRSPEDYLRDIARRMPAPEPAAPGRPEVAIPADQALTPPAPQPVAPQQPGVAEAIPAPAPVNTAPAAAPAPSVAEGVPSTAVQVGETAPEPRLSARQLYTTARDQYKNGNWQAARKNFVAAIDAGYKSRLFEESPQTYLRRMDKKEQQDQALAVRQTPSSPSPTDMSTTAAAVAPAPAAPEAVALAQAPAPAPIDVTPAPEPAPAPADPAPAPAPAPSDVAPAPADVAPAPAPAPAPRDLPPAPAPAPVPAPAPLTPQPGNVVTAPAPAPAQTPQQQLNETASMQGTSAASNAARARQLVDEGRRAQQANDFQTALNRYADAAAL